MKKINSDLKAKTNLAAATLLLVLAIYPLRPCGDPDVSSKETKTVTTTQGNQVK